MMSKKEKGGLRAGEIAASCVLIVAVLLCITITTQVLTVGYVQVAGYSVFRVATGSMEPTILVDAVLVCKEASVEEIREDDIICFRSQEQGMMGSVITHRVVQIHTMPDGSIALETRGDANPVADSKLVTEKNLIGKVIWFTGERNAMTAVLAFMNNKIGFLACIVFPCLLVAGSILRGCIGNIRTEMNAMMKELEAAETEEETEAAEETKETEEKEPELTPEEYQQLYEQVRIELMKELGLSGEESAQ